MGQRGGRIGKLCHGLAVLYRSPGMRGTQEGSKDFRGECQLLDENRTFEEFQTFKID